MSGPTFTYLDIGEIVELGVDDEEDTLIAAVEAREFGDLLAAAPAMGRALQTAERFMRGFEDDDMQDGIGEQLAEIREALVNAGLETL